MTDNAPKRRCIRPTGPNGSSSTQVKGFRTQHLWTINQFNFQYTNIKTLKSSKFTSDVDGSTKCTWYISLDCSKDDDFIAIYLNLDSTCNEDRSAFSKYRFSIMTKEQKEMHIVQGNVRKFHISSDEEYTEDSDGWGTDQFVNRDLLFKNRNELIPDNKLTIFCEITYFHIFTSISHQPNLITVRPPVTNRLSEDFGSMLKNRKFADVTIVVNGTEYPVHRTVLAARSAVFSAMFEQNGMKESEKNRIDVTDISEDVMEEMLRYIYTANVKNLNDIADDLFEAADKYDLGELKVLCESFLYNDLSVDNAASTLALADLHRAYGFKSKVMNYIVLNFGEVKRTEGWKTLAGSRNDLLNEVCEALSLN
ncbi:hypothetical protein U1Q18_046959 [Sarracenia purpurea var. burkii]